MELILKTKRPTDKALRGWGYLRDLYLHVLSSDRRPDNNITCTEREKECEIVTGNKDAQSSYSLSLSTFWNGMNGCLLYSVAGEVLCSGWDFLGDGRGEQGGVYGGSL